MLKHCVLFCVLIVVTGTALTGSVLAATAVKLDMPTLVERSDIIVVAEVTELESELESDGRVYTTISFRTDQVLKGQPGKEFELRLIGGRADGVATAVPGMPDFDAGEEVFLFLTNVDEIPVITGLSQGKFRVVVGPDESTRYVVPQIDGVRLIAPKDAPPRRVKDSKQLGPPPSIDTADHRQTFRQVHEFNAFRQRVRALVEAQRKGD